MTSSALIAAIGWSHLLQPPITAFLASKRGLALKSSIHASTEVAEGVIQNMGTASVVLPTTLGILLACHADRVGVDSTATSLAWLLAAFWSWRLWRQWRLWAGWPSNRIFWWYLLAGIFVVQGPVLGMVLTGWLP